MLSIRVIITLHFLLQIPEFGTVTDVQRKTDSHINDPKYNSSTLDRTSDVIKVIFAFFTVSLPISMFITYFASNEWYKRKDKNNSNTDEISNKYRKELEDVVKQFSDSRIKEINKELRNKDLIMESKINALRKVLKINEEDHNNILRRLNELQKDYDTTKQNVDEIDKDLSTMVDSIFAAYGDRVYSKNYINNI